MSNDAFFSTRVAEKNFFFFSRRSHTGEIILTTSDIRDVSDLLP